MQHLINGLPRKILGYKTAREKYIYKTDRRRQMRSYTNKNEPNGSSLHNTLLVALKGCGAEDGDKRQRNIILDRK